jgi:hypothetical protein
MVRPGLGLGPSLSGLPRFQGLACWSNHAAEAQLFPGWPVVLVVGVYDYLVGAYFVIGLASVPLG